MARLLSLLFLLAPLAAAQPAADTLGAQADTLARAQAGTFARGVTWTPPAEQAEALAELRAMHGAGVRAVRLPYPGFGEPPVGGALFRTADALGLALHLDMPVRFLAASALRDTTAFAERVLAEVTALAAAHPSVQSVGLATAVDTSEPSACAYFEHLAPRAREAGLTATYETRFIESDRCSGAVDLVLLDARDRDPIALLDRWEAAHGTPAGLGTLGTAVTTRSESGHRTPGTVAHQQRRLETQLRALGQRGVEALYVDTWRGGRYSLHASEGEARPALSVLRGFYTGRQTVFAVDAGREPYSLSGTLGFSVLGWILALLLVGLVALAPRFRQLVPRYFTRHGYYREAVQRSVGLEGFAAVAVVIGLAIAGGLLGGAGLYSLMQTEALEALLYQLGPTAQERILAISGLPIAVVGVVSLFYGTWLVLTMGWLLLLAGRRRRVRPMQAVILTAFSRWAVFILAILALLALQSGEPSRWLPPVLWTWLAVEVLAGVRVLYDYSLVTRVPMGRSLGLGMLLPLVVVVGVVGLVIWQAGPSATFLWHLATRT